MDAQTNQTARKRTVKATWNKRNILAFCDICIQAIEKGMRPGTHFSKEGWIYVITNFNAVIGCTYDKKMLKNKWDQLKKEWKVWKELIGEETGLGWDSKRNTIDATQEWWNEKIKVVPAVAKFQNKGLEPDFVQRLDYMFSNTMAMGEHVWAPSSTIPIADDNIHDNVHVVSEESNIDGEGCGDSIDEDFENSLDELKQNTIENIDNASIGSRNKRKMGKATTSGKGKNVMKKLGGATKLREDMSRLVASEESRNSLISMRNDTRSCSISELMQEVKSLPGVENGSKLYFFAAFLFEQKPKREGYLAMSSLEEKLGWLKFQYKIVKGSLSD